MQNEVSQAAYKIGRQNISNIVAKVKSGKTLSISEQNAMDKWEFSENDGEWVKDTTALAKELGVSRRTIYDARAKFPEKAPKKEANSRRENLIAWQNFCAENLIGKDTATVNLSELKAQLMQREIKLRDMKIAREAGESIAKEVVDDMLATLSQKLDLLLRLKLEVELGPRAVGMNAAEMNVEGGVIVDEIREVINSNIALYQGDMVRTSARVSDSL
jgi:hypothetical protein